MDIDDGEINHSLSKYKFFVNDQKHDFRNRNWGGDVRMKPI